MPIYEFYCQDCHTVFNFLSRAPDVRTRPDCPSCGRPKLERRASLFAVSRGRGTADDAGPAGLDAARLERAMSDMARGVESAPDDDPRRMAGMMRKLLDGSGLRFGPSMDEALQRLEAGEDPETIDAELGQEEPEDGEESWIEAAGSASRSARRRLVPPRVDDRLYEL